VRSYAASGKIHSGAGDSDSATQSHLQRVCLLLHTRVMEFYEDPAFALVVDHANTDICCLRYCKTDLATAVGKCHRLSLSQ